MSFFAQALKKKGTASPRPVRPATVMPESPAAQTVLPPLPDASLLPAVGVRQVGQIARTDALAALRESAIPEAPGFRPVRKPEDCPAEERALRDEKIRYIRAVWELHVATNCGEGRAAALIAEKQPDDFPRLATAGKGGSSALRYNNYRNWINGYGSGGRRRPGIGRLNDGTPDYRNADVLLPNYVRGHKNTVYGDPMFWAELKGVWLRNGEPYLAKNYRRTRMIWEACYPGQLIPTLAQVRYHFQHRFPHRMVALARKGENWYDQNLRNFIERDPDSIRPGEAWVADTKDCDFQIRTDNPDAKPIRPKLVVIMDVKSQFPVSVQLIDGNCSNEVIRNGFAAAVWRFGRPRIFLTDNGKDYCKAGFGDPVVFAPSVDGGELYEHSILRELDVEHHKAIPYNARAKIVERFFREVAGYERDSRGYVGNKPETRPATADVWAKLKARKYLNSLDEACEWVAQLVRVYLNTPSDGKFLAGMTPVQAFRPEIRYTRPKLSYAECFRAFQLPLQDSKKLDGRGPSVRLDNGRYVVIPADRERAWKYDGKRVMIKTVIFNKEVCYIYDLDGTYIAECRLEEKLPYFGADPKLLAAKLEEQRAEKVALRARIWEETKGWHLIDAETTYQQPREAFASPAPARLIETMHSVKGETHNPRVYVLENEVKPEPCKTVCANSDPESPKAGRKKAKEATPKIETKRLNRILRTINGEDEPAAFRSKNNHIHKEKREYDDDECRIRPRLPRD